MWLPDSIPLKYLRSPRRGEAPCLASTAGVVEEPRAISGRIPRRSLLGEWGRIVVAETTHLLYPYLGMTVPSPAALDDASD